MGLSLEDGARRIRIIGAASGLGAQDPGCADGPVAFHRSQAWHALQDHPQIDWGRTLYARAADGHGALGRIAALCKSLADEVAETLRAGAFPLVIGGDHSIAVGTWSGVARQLGAPCGLLWMDAHLDAHTPETSYSGAWHGMPLACLFGQGDKRLLDLGLVGRQLDVAHTAVFGPRSWEPEEAALLQRLGVRIFARDEIERRGFVPCLDEALAIVRGAPAGFGITLDLDVIDPDIAPGVGSPEPDGLSAAEVRRALRGLATDQALRAMEIVEYNPDRDRDGLTARLIAGLIGDLLPGLTRKPRRHAPHHQIGRAHV